jgi:hypothetical protein
MILAAWPCGRAPGDARLQGFVKLEGLAGLKPGSIAPTSAGHKHKG